MQSPEGKIFAGNILCQVHREMIHDANDRLVVSRTLLFSQWQSIDSCEYAV